MKDRIFNCLQGFALFTGVWVAVLLLAGCGYHFVGGSGGGETFYPHLKTIYVETFANRTSEANAENIFRSAFNSEMVQRGRFKLVSRPEEADSIFRGTIVALVANPLAYKPTNLSAEDRLTIILDLSFVENSSGNVLWANNAFTMTGDYAVTSVGVTETSRRTALTKLASDVAGKAYRAMISNF